MDTFDISPSVLGSSCINQEHSITWRQVPPPIGKHLISEVSLNKQPCGSRCFPGQVDRIFVRF